MVSVQYLKSGGRLFLAALLCCHIPVAAVAADSPDADVAAHMHQHLSAMRAMKLFIVAGQLDGMREPAVWLQEHQATPGLPGDWQAYVMQLRRYAGEAAAARHLDSGAALVSEMARVCGDCHAANSVEANLDDGGSLPPDRDSVTVQMQRHMWAVDRMWAGLISPSDEAWVEGAAVLATIRLTPADIGLSEANEPKLSYLLDRAREIGVQGEIADGRQARSALYGELLGLCADCHNVTGGGPAR